MLSYDSNELRAIGYQVVSYGDCYYKIIDGNHETHALCATRETNPGFNQ